MILATHCKGIVGQGYKCEDPNNDPHTMYIRNFTRDHILNDLNTFVTYYQNARYGRETGSVPPYSLYESAIDEADSMIEGCNSSLLEGPADFFSCYPANLQINIFKPVTLMIMTPITDGKNIKFNNTDIMYQQLWNMMTMGICSKLLFPMFDNIIPEMEHNLNSILPPITAGVIIILVLGFITVIIIMIQTFSSESKMRFALTLLVHCPPTVVMQTPKIMSILSGDFSNQTKDSSGHNSDFFDSIVRSIPDSVIVCNSNYKIINANKASERIYGMNADELIEKDAREFFSNSSLFKGETNDLFEKSDSTANIEFQNLVMIINVFLK